MASKRVARINEQLRRELSELLRTSVRDPRVGVVTVTAVDVATDLASARVYVRLQGADAEKQASLEGLHAAAPFLRGTLGRMLRVRRIPELRFLEDTSLEHAQRIEALLAEVLPHDSSEDPSPSPSPGSVPSADGATGEEERDA